MKGGGIRPKSDKNHFFLKPSLMVTFKSKGKYVEILFSAGQPTGGQISNFLLEKSRVVSQNLGKLFLNLTRETKIRISS